MRFWLQVRQLAYRIRDLKTTPGKKPTVRVHLKSTGRSLRVEPVRLNAPSRDQFPPFVRQPLLRRPVERIVAFDDEASDTAILLRLASTLRVQLLKLLAAGTIGALAISAYSLYESGQPGMPVPPKGYYLSNEPYSDNTPAINVYTSPELPLEQHIGMSSDGKFTFSLSQVKPLTKPAYVVVQFQGAEWPTKTAEFYRPGTPSTDRDTSAQIAGSSTSFLLKFESGVETGSSGPIFEGKLQSPVISKENARILVSLPKLDYAWPCLSLKAKPANINFADFSDAVSGFDCQIGEDPLPEQRKSATIDDISPQDYKIDYTSVPVAQENFFAWDSQKSLKVNASLTDIQAESRGQRNLFIAGIIGGLICGFVPMALERVWQSTRRHDRQLG